MLPIRVGLFTCLLLPLATAFAQIDTPPPNAEPIRAQLELITTAEASMPEAFNRISAADLQAFYAQAGFKPIWNESSRLSALITELELTAEDGLQPEDYAVEPLLKILADPARAAPLAEGAPPDPARICEDILATRAYLQALTHLHYGKLEPGSVEAYWQFDGKRSTPDRTAIGRIAHENIADLGTAFETARPQTPQYQNLRKVFVTLRDKGPESNWPALPGGPSLRAGETSDRVPLLRHRLSLGGYGKAELPADTDVNLFDEALVEAVMQFQRDHRLKDDGVVGQATLRALNVPLADRIEQIKVNLERLRWFAHRVDSDFVLVDVAGAGIRYVRDGEVVWSARTQVGRPSRPTPLLRSEITHFTLNPTWTVPPTILREDKLPEIRADLGYLERNRFKVLDASGTPISAEEIDWHSPGAITLRQDAGPGNALGKAVIRFPNPYAVYLHDTPSQGLFARDQRAFSSGCVRVENALSLIEQLLADRSSVSAEQLQDMLATGRTRRVNLDRPIPILIAYWTVDITDQGRVEFRSDLYGHDRKLAAALAKPFALVAQEASCP